MTDAMIEERLAAGHDMPKRHFKDIMADMQERRQAHRRAADGMAAQALSCGKEER